MGRVFFVHQNLERALDAVHKLRGEGHVVRGHAELGPPACAILKDWRPEVLVVVLAKLPAKLVVGDVPHWTSMVKAAEDIARCPVVFVGGNAERLTQASEQFPLATQCAYEQLGQIVTRHAPAIQTRAGSVVG